jgi:hypothetical protein
MEWFIKACMFCRSTYDSKPPFRVYIDLEDDPSSTQKVAKRLGSLGVHGLQMPCWSEASCCSLYSICRIIIKHTVAPRITQAILLIKVRAEYASDKSASSLEVHSHLRLLCRGLAFWQCPHAAASSANQRTDERSCP